MILKRILQKFNYWRLSRGWRILNFCRLHIDFKDFTINGLGFGSTPAEASFFGRPERIQAVGDDVFQFEFRSKVLLL